MIDGELAVLTERIRMAGDPSESSSEESAGVRAGGSDSCLFRENNRMVCLVVGEVRKGRVRGFLEVFVINVSLKCHRLSSLLTLPCSQSLVRSSPLHPRPSAALELLLRTCLLPPPHITILVLLIQTFARLECEVIEGLSPPKPDAIRT